MGAYEGALKSSMTQADPQQVDNCSEIGADVRRWPRARDSLHSMSDKARGNARDGGGMSPGTPRATYGRGDDDESNYSPVIWQGRLGSAAKGRLNTPRYPREDSCALSPSP